MKPSVLFLAAVAASICGCASYQYRIVQPPTADVVLVDHPVTVRLDPLEYHLAMVRDYWGPPPVAYYQVSTVFDWNWKTGPARLRLTYDRNGQTFEHDLEIIRELKP